MSVKEIVDSAIKDNKIVIFSKSYCHYCKETKSLFAENYSLANVSVKIFELDEMDNGKEIQDYLYEKTGQSTVPNVFISGKHIGGTDDLHAAHKRGDIEVMLRE